MLQLTAISANESWSLDRWHQFILALLVFTFSKLWKQNLPGHKAPVRMCQKRESSLHCNTTGNLTWKKKPSAYSILLFMCTGLLLGYWHQPKGGCLTYAAEEEAKVWWAGEYSKNERRVWFSSDDIMFETDSPVTRAPLYVCLPSFISHT